MMNRRLKYNVALLASALVFLCSFGATLANWFVAEDSVGRLTLGIVSGEIRESYEQGQTVFPGQTAEKIVNIENTGNVDCLVRVSLDKVWVSDTDNTLDTSVIHITCDNERWHYNPADGYYYYKGVLAPAELTDTALMSSFTLDGGAGNIYAGKTADIRVALECIQAGGNGISAWGMSLEELGIEYEPDKNEIPSIYVGFVSPDDGFEFDIFKGDLFMNFKELVPGEERSEILEVANVFDEQVEIFVRAQLPEEISAQPEKTELVEKLLEQYAIITLTGEDGKVIYSGPVWSPEESSVSMRENLSLGVFTPESRRNYTVTLMLAPELDNAYRELLGSVKWIFEASGSDETVTEHNHSQSIPKTGDSQLYMCICVCTMLISGTLTVILFFRRHERCNN